MYIQKGADEHSIRRRFLATSRILAMCKFLRFFAKADLLVVALRAAFWPGPIGRRAAFMSFLRADI